MARKPGVVSSIVLVLAFAAVAASAGLQWVEKSARAEAARRQASRQSVEQFSTLMQRFEDASARERPKVAEDLAGAAERLAEQTKIESLAAASRRVEALASFETQKQARQSDLQERLRAEIRELVSEAESMEASARGRATRLEIVHQLMLMVAAVLCGWRVLLAGQANLTA